MSKYKDPEGGLTEAGRRKFERSGESKNLQAGVKESSPTGQKARRKGSFLTRFYTNPSGPLVNDKGKPTRLALAANAWGEPVPRTRDAAARLAAKGRSLLRKYQKEKS
tara:strand:- start:1 stop:324 length:324 start_codon:yes stop_codon:yes gene_type:complete